MTSLDNRNAASSRSTGRTGLRRPQSPAQGRIAREKARIALARQDANRRRWSVPLGQPDRRARIALVAFAVVTSFLALRAIQVQGLDPEALAGRALRETLSTAIVPATRGTITDRNGELLIVSEPAVNIVANPYIVVVNGKDPDKMRPRDRLRAAAGIGITAGLLQHYLGGRFEDYYSALARSQTEAGEPVNYAVLGRNVRDYINVSIKNYLADLGYVGLSEESAPVRSYPNGTLAANLLGYMFHDDELEAEGKNPDSGGGGLELGLNEQLAGVDGEEQYELSSYGRIPTGRTTLKEPQDGISYELTIDAGMQYMTETELKTMVERFNVKSGTAIVLSIKTGEVLAMATYPTFDPNSAPGNLEDTKQRALTDVYEPGSVQKVLTLAALLDAGLVSPTTQVTIPNAILSGDELLHDFDPWHDTWYLTATGVMAWSSNIGTVLLTRQMDKAVLADYLTAFGLGARTGLNYPNEGSGKLPEEWTDQDRDHVAFGQGLSVTALQEASAVAAAVNRGLYVSPTLIKRAWTADGQAYEIPRQVTRQVISEQASDDVLGMMEATNLDHGLSIAGYRTGGKTGTADRYDEALGTYHGNVSSYVGVGPVEDPEILTYVVMDDPDRNVGSTSVAWVGLDILQVALNRYGAKPSTLPAPEYPIGW